MKYDLIFELGTALFGTLILFVTLIAFMGLDNLEVVMILSTVAFGVLFAALSLYLHFYKR